MSRQLFDHPDLDASIWYYAPLRHVPYFSWLLEHGVWHVIEDRRAYLEHLGYDREKHCLDDSQIIILKAVQDAAFTHHLILKTIQDDAFTSE